MLQERRLWREQLINSAALQHVLAWEVLPRLSLHNLAALACSCTSLRAVAYQHDELWTAVLLQSSCQHSTLRCPRKDRAGVQALMQRRAVARQSISSGRTNTLQIAVLQEQVQELLYSPFSNQLAVITSTHAAVYSTADGKEAWRRTKYSIERAFRDSTQTDDCFLSHWQFGPDALFAFGCASCRSSDYSDYDEYGQVHLTELDQGCGDIKASRMLRLECSVELEDFGLYGSEPALSPSASLLAVQLSLSKGRTTLLGG